MDPVELLRGMVAIPSLSGDEAALSHHLVERMTDLGFAAEVDEAGNAVGVLGDGPREIVLLGHLDTVPGGPPVEIRDGRLFGRGAVDAKGPLATFVLAASALGPVPGWRIVVIGAVEEEAPSSKGARHVAPLRRPDACVIGEPSGWDGVALGYKGRLVVDASLRQPSVHSAAPEPSAAERIVSLWNAVGDEAGTFNAGRGRLFDQLQCRLQRIEGGVDGDRETARAVLGFRLPMDLSPEDLRSRLLRLAENGGPEIVLEVTGAEPAYLGDRRSPLAGAFLRALREAGAEPRMKVKTGTSDMNVVGPVWQCPILAYGPGDSRLDHTPEEHVEIGEYLKAVEVLRRALGLVTG
jgi:LysW-gamma-L-lysine carboxypeptidase